MSSPGKKSLASQVVDRSRVTMAMPGATIPALTEIPDKSAISPRPYANSARKRRYIPNLSRPVASPSRSEKVSMMFQDAAAASHTKASTTPTSPNIRTSRIPLAQARQTAFGQSPNRSTRSPYSYRTPPKAAATEGWRSSSPLKTGDEDSDPVGGYQPHVRTGESHPITAFSSCDAANEHRGEHIKYPKLAPSASYHSDAKHHLSQHGTKIITPTIQAEGEEAQQLGIRTWLEGLHQPGKGAQQAVHDSGTQPMLTPSIKTGELESPIRSSSNKENISPAQPFSPKRPPITYPNISTPSRFHKPDRPPPNPLALQPQTSSPSPHPRTPGRHFSQPPRRQRPQLAALSTKHDGPISPEDLVNRPLVIHEDADHALSPDHDPPSTPCDRTIPSEDHLASALASLSPCVEVERKRRGRHGQRRPQQQRCRSYWDDDVLPVGTAANPVVELDGGDGVQKRERGGDTGVRKLRRSGKEVRVLGESEDQEMLTRERAFVEEAEGWEFRLGS